MAFPNFNDRITPFNGLMNQDDNAYQPNNDISDAIKRLLAQQPPESHPGILKRILGGIVGMGAGSSPSAVVGGQPIGFNFDAQKQAAATDNFLNFGENKFKSDQAEQLKMLQPLLANEQQQNTQKRILYDAKQTNDRLVKRDEETSKNNAASLKIKQQLADAKDWSNNHPNMVKVTDKNGMLIFIDPKDPSNRVDTGIDTTELSALEKADLALKGKLEEIVASGKERMKQIDEQGALRLQQIGETANQARTTKAAPSNASSNETPTQTSTRIKNIISQAKRDHPEWQKWFDDKGDIIPPAGPRGKILGMQLPGSTNGPDQATYDAIKSYIASEALKANPTSIKPNGGVLTAAQPIKYDDKTEAFITDAIAKLKMTREQVITNLKQRGIIK